MYRKKLKIVAFSLVGYTIKQNSIIIINVDIFFSTENNCKCIDLFFGTPCVYILCMHMVHNNGPRLILPTTPRAYPVHVENSKTERQPGDSWNVPTNLA